MKGEEAPEDAKTWDPEITLEVPHSLEGRSCILPVLRRFCPAAVLAEKAGHGWTLDSFGQFCNATCSSGLGFSQSFAKCQNLASGLHMSRPV